VKYCIAYDLQLVQHKYVCLCGFYIIISGDTGVIELTKGLVTLSPKADPGAFSGQTGMEDPQEDPLAVHCLCVCSEDALFGDLIGITRSMECELLSVLLICPRIFLRLFIVHRLLVVFLYV